MKATFQDDLTKALRIQTKIENREPLSRDEESWLKAEKKRGKKDVEALERKVERGLKSDERYRRKIKNISVGRY